MSDNEPPNESDENVDNVWGDALAEQADNESTDKNELEALEDIDDVLSGDHPNMEVIMEIPVEISMEVGKTNISIRNLLKLSQGSVVELDRFAGEPLDVFVNGTIIHELSIRANKSEIDLGEKSPTNATTVPFSI